RCVAKPQKSNHSVNLLAGKVTNVLNAIDPFKRPPMFFGLRFRFPPVQVVQHEEGAEDDLEDKPDFIAVRFETYAKDINQVWIEVNAMNVFPNVIDVTDVEKIRANIQSAYSFLTNECIDFLDQFDERADPPIADDGKKED